MALGTYPFANVFTQIDEGQARSIVQMFLNSGGFFIDTAPTYGLGQVENLLGRILRNFRRDRYFVASKCGYVWDQASPPRLSGKYEDIVAECDKSRGRLQLEQLDLYILHEPDPQTPPEETIAALTDLQAKGKVKHIGISNVTLPQLKHYNATGRVEFVQNRFSLLNQSTSQEFLAYCTAHGIGLTPYQVIERGLLTDRCADGIVLRQGDLRHTKPEFGREVPRVIGEWAAECLQPIARSQKTSVAALAIWWSIQQPGIAFIICGATNVAQVTANLQAAALDPEPGTQERINASYNILKERLMSNYSSGVPEFMGLA